MSEEKTMRLGQIARKLNVGISTIVESMAKKGFDVENNPNSKISQEQFDMLAKEFKSSAQEKEEASHLSIGKRHHETFTIEAESEVKEEKKVEPIAEVKKPEPVTPAPVSPKAEEQPKEKIAVEAPKLQGITVLGKIDLEAQKSAPKKEEVKPQPETAPATPPTPPLAKTEIPVQEKVEPKPQAVKPQTEDNTKVPKDSVPTAKAPIEEKPKVAPEPKPVAEKPERQEKPIEKIEPKPEEKVIAAKADALKGLTVLGKIELPDDKSKKKGKPVASSDEKGKDKKKRIRKRIDKKGGPATKAPETDPNKPRPAGQGPGQEAKALHKAKGIGNLYSSKTSVPKDRVSRSKM
jgi:translation initiation factor IF-2